MLWLFYLAIFIPKSIQIDANNWAEILGSNGWTPITREKVFSGLNTKVTPELQYPNVLDTHRKGKSLDSNEDKLKNHDFDESSFITVNKKWDPKRSSSDLIAEINLIGTADVSRKEYNNDEFHIAPTTERLRKTKDISSNVQSANNYDGGLQETYTKNANIITKRYEVIEHNDFEELLKEDKSDFNVNNDLGYMKNRSNETSADNIKRNENDFTNKLLNILSSYNIKVNDNLPNYELSRGATTSKKNPPKQEFLLLPIPIKYSNRYNSLNHLTVDPLLAVFLSNYGYYLPGQYGLHNKYHNLYGYLASNNIHNNKPFGSYKIFADTDSSN